jgi:serine/threonine-protein kinase
MLAGGPERGRGYRILERLSAGQSADVYRARDEKTGREVAVKVFRGEAAACSQRAKPNENAVHTIARLAHPNVVEVLGSGVADLGPFLVMEYLEGVTLRRALSRRGPLEAAAALAVLAPVLAGLEAGHRAGHVHGDLKPENVFLARGRAPGRARVKLLDFGSHAATQGADATQVVIGTPGYLSPEQACGEPVDARSDVFAAGVLLFEMLAGRRPFDGPNPVATAYRTVHQPPPELESRLAPVLRVALAKDPRRRFRSAASFAAALDADAPEVAVTRAALAELARL